MGFGPQFETFGQVTWMKGDGHGSFESRVLLASGAHNDSPILVTDLEHRSLACNERFGEYFRVDPQKVVKMGVDELRSVVIPRLRDPEGWLQQLDEIYAEPELTYQDEMELLATSVTSDTNPSSSHGHDSIPAKVLP